MGKRDMKNKTPPSGAKSQSLVLRLNTRLFFRQLGIFLCMDLLLVVLALMGQLMWAEKRCADVAQLVQERGVPTAEAVPWMAASDYTIIPLDREPKGVDVGELGWFSGREATADGLRTYVLFSYYTVELPNGGEPYAITVDLSGIGRMLKWAGFILLTVQIISLIANLFRNAGTIRRTLRPIQELAATAARLNSMTHMSRRELEALAGELEEVLGFVRRYIRFDVLDEPVGAIELCGYTPEQLREYSHYPEKHFGQPHFLACYTDGPALLAVNKLRTVVRQTELAAYAAFRDADGNVTRGDMILGLNRLSSLMWIFMIKLKAGRYDCK